MLWDIWKLSAFQTLEMCQTEEDAVDIICHTIYFGLKMFRAHGLLATCFINYCKESVDLEIDPIGYSAVTALCAVTMASTEEQTRKLLNNGVFEVISGAYDKYDEETDHLIDDAVCALMFGNDQE